MDFAIITLDTNGRVLSWNMGAERILGWTEKERVGSTAELIFTPEDRLTQVPQKEIREALKSPDIQAKALQFGLDARGTTPEEMQARMRADIEKWAAVIENAGFEKQ